MNEPPTLFVARLAGSQAEMGDQHGRLVADDAVRLLRFYRSMPERLIAGDRGILGKLTVRAIAMGWQARLARDRPAEFAARTRAFVDAVAATTNEPGCTAHLAFAAMDALQNIVSLAARLHHGPFAGALSSRGVAAAVPACSTAIAWGSATADGELWFARNFDFPGVGVWDARPAFVLCAPERGQRYGFFTTRGADTAVVTVVNEAGLVIAPHTRWHRDVTFGGAMIIDVVHAIAARAETLADAHAIAREHRASSSWGIAIGSARERSACVLELAGPRIDVVRPAPGNTTLVCTNRYRSAAMVTGELAASYAWKAHSERREQRLRELIEQRGAPLTPQHLARFLGDRIDPCDPAGIARQLGGVLAQPLNVHCVVVAPALRRAHLGVDRAPCCEGAWLELAWQWAGSLGGCELAPSLAPSGSAVSSIAPSGFTAASLTGFVAPHGEAARHVHEAVRVYDAIHDVGAALAALEQAITHEPTDPSLRLAALWLSHEAGYVARAVEHARAGLAHEAEPYRRGQLLLWGFRAVQRGIENSDSSVDEKLAARWRAELFTLRGEGVAELVSHAARPHTRTPRGSLTMLDAY